MSENTQGGTLWTQSTFDSLFAALDRPGNEAELREMVGSLKEKGYSVEAIANRAKRALGPQGAVRIRELAGGARAAISRPRRRYRVNRFKRMRNRAREVWEQLDDFCHRFTSRFERRS